MIRKLLKICMALVFLFGLYGTASAGDNHWLVTNVDRDWNNAANWDDGVAPDGVQDTIDLRESEVGYTTVDNGPLLGVGDVGSAYRVFLGQNDGPSMYGELTMDGGTLTTTGYMSTAYHAGTSALITMNSGTVYIGDPAGANGHLYLGRAGTAIFNMSGGSFTTDDDINIAHAGGYGEINLSGGTLTASTLKFTGSGLIDIAGGTLILKGDDTATLAGFIANGWITGYGIEDNVGYDLTTNPGDTTVWGIPEPATICLLAIGALGLLRRRK